MISLSEHSRAINEDGSVKLLDVDIDIQRGSVYQTLRGQAAQLDLQNETFSFWTMQSQDCMELVEAREQIRFA